MFEVRTTREYETWFCELRDDIGKTTISARIDRLGASEHWGDAKPVGEGVIELRVACGPGYRIYCSQVGRTVVLLLNGGDKSSQKRDIAHAKELAKKWQA